MMMNKMILFSAFLFVLISLAMTTTNWCSAMSSICPTEASPIAGYGAVRRAIRISATVGTAIRRRLCSSKTGISCAGPSQTEVSLMIRRAC